MRKLLAALILASGAGFPQTVPAGAGRRAPVTPGRGAAPAAKSAAAAATGPRELKFPPLRSVQSPKVAVSTLPNGMKLYLSEEHELPVLGGVVTIRTGAAFDPPDRIGLAGVAGILLRSGGTSLKTGEQVDEALQGLGMTLDSTIGDTSGVMAFTAIKENADASLALLKEILTQAEFRQDRLEQAKAQIRNLIAHRNDDLAIVGRRELAGLIFGKNSPFGWQPEYASIARITRRDLKAFHQRYVFPANVMLGIQGDFDAAQMKAAMEKLFADWTVKQDPVPQFPKVKATPVPGIYLAEKIDAPQTYLAIGHVGGIVNNKDFPALEVTGLLFNGLQARISRRAQAPLGSNGVGLIGVAVEDVNAAWGATFDHEGVFRISLSTRGAATVDALRAVQTDIERMRSADVTDEELKTAKDRALADLSATWATHGKAFLRVMNQEYYGYPKDFAQQHQAGIAAVTKADVLRVAREYLNPANVAMVVVGNPQVFSEPLEKLNPQVHRIDLTIPPPKAIAAESSDATIAEAKRLLARAQAAAGGAEKLAAVTDCSVSAEYLIDAAAQSFRGSRILETDRWIAPATFRQELGLPTGRITAYTDGKAGWLATQQGWGPLVGVQLKQVQGDLFRMYVRLLLSDRIEGRSVNAVDLDMIEVSDSAGQLARLEFDPKTGLPRRVTYDTPQASGGTLFAEEVYDDFRDVNGIRVPFKFFVNQGGRKFADVNVTEYKINSGLRAVDLARRTQ